MSLITAQKRNNCSVVLDMNQVSLICSYVFHFNYIFLKQNSISARDIVKVVDGPHTVCCVHTSVCVCVCVCVCVQYDIIASFDLILG